MANRRLIKCAIAYERMQEVVREDNSNIELSNLIDNCTYYAINRSGQKDFGSNRLGYLVLSSLIGAVGGVALSSTSIVNEDHSLMNKIIYNSGAGFCGIIGSLILTGTILFVKTYTNEKSIENIIKERTKRKNQKIIKKISESQRKSIYNFLKEI